MPAKYARYFIKITGVRAEKLQDISSEDCIKGGIVAIPQKYNGAFIYDNLLDRERYNTPVQACAALIDRIGGRGTWKNNPYVWVYDFKLATLQGDRQINYRVKQ
jgi:hypothetical protein